jgi:hypothetical protein
VLRRSLRNRIGDLDPSLRVFAEDLLGETSTIDLLAVDRTGGLVVVLIGDEGSDLELVARALALCAWVRPRIRDWLQLAPDLGLSPDAGARALICCPSFQAETITAAGSLGPAVLELVRYRWVRNSGSEGVLLERLAAPGGARVPDPDDGRVAEPAPFRTGLSDEDLNLSDEERSEFE